MSLSNLTGQVLDEKYRIEKELGKGGMGAVYFATHLGTDRPVAVKVIAPQFMLNDEFVERFKREAKAAGRMRHPNVVDVTDFGFATVGRERVAYLVMEYLDGCALSEVLAEESRLPIDWVVDILEQTCSAVDEAHRAGTIHRDLKPDNIWLEPNRRGGYTVKVLDFGLAKHHDLMSSPVETISTGEAASTTDSPTVALPPSAQTTAVTGLTHRTEMIEAATQALSPDLNDAATQAISPDLNEAATLAQVPPAQVTSAAEEDRPLIPSLRETRARPAPEDDEASTKLLPPEDEEATLALPSLNDNNLTRKKRITNESLRTTTEDNRAQVTASPDGLTRVGSILGTPTYMSPEQCRGEQLDARSDIYSLGVIAYQMIAGEPPFKGTMHEVMRQHMEDQPPPLREKRKKVPKRMAAIVMSALAKNPDQRPASANSFASALRASSEGTGKLLRRAFALYSEHFPPFFRLALSAYMPVFALSVILSLNNLLRSQMVLSPLASKIAAIIIGILLAFANFIATSVITGVTIRFVSQLFVAPLRPLKLRSELRALKKRLWPLLTTTFIVGLLSILGLVLLIVPGVIFFINSSLSAPVVVMENLKGRAAIKRSKSLVKRSRRTVIAILIIQYAIPIIASSIMLSAFGLATEAMRSKDFGRVAAQVIGTILNVFFIPLIAIMTALLYLKVRQLGGERLKDVLDQFEQEEVPQTRWQKRMRERLTSSSHSTRSA